MPDKKEKKNKIPELYFVFDERGEVHADIANKAIMVKKGDQHDHIMEFATGLGKGIRGLKFNTIIERVDVDEARKTFEEEGYVVLQANAEDFKELQRELDKLLTVQGGESKDYPRGS